MIDPMARKRPSPCLLAGVDRGDGLCHNCLWPAGEHLTHEGTPTHQHTVGSDGYCPNCESDPNQKLLAEVGEVASEAAREFISKMVPQDPDESDEEYFMRTTSVVISSGEVLQKAFADELHARGLRIVNK